MTKKVRSIALKLSFLFLIACSISILISEKIIINNATQKVFSETANIPKNKVGVLLGISRKVKGGENNPYFDYRTAAAVTLFKAEKITYIVVSGNGDDGSDTTDSQVESFKKELIKAGVPSENIILDTAGYRTLDSAVRVKEIFGQNSVTMISQKFHNERAIYLAEQFGIKAVGFNAKDVTGVLLLKRHFREPLARVKVFIDLFLDIQPRVLGDKIEIK